jgi:hypothetical protein
MAQDHQSFALAFWRSKLRAKQKPLQNKSEGLLKIIAVATAWSFLTLAGFLRESPQPDPKL